MTQEACNKEDTSDIVTSFSCTRTLIIECMQCPDADECRGAWHCSCGAAQPQEQRHSRCWGRGDSRRWRLSTSTHTTSKVSFFARSLSGTFYAAALKQPQAAHKIAQPCRLWILGAAVAACSGLSRSDTTHSIVWLLLKAGGSAQARALNWRIFQFYGKPGFGKDTPLGQEEQ